MLAPATPNWVTFHHVHGLSCKQGLASHDKAHLTSMISYKRQYYSIKDVNIVLWCMHINFITSHLGTRPIINHPTKKLVFAHYLSYLTCEGKKKTKTKTNTESSTSETITQAVYLVMALAV